MHSFHVLAQMSSVTVEALITTNDIPETSSFFVKLAARCHGTSGKAQHSKFPKRPDWLQRYMFTDTDGVGFRV